MPYLDPQQLIAFSTQLLATAATPDEASTIAASLVGANLRGYDSHGVMRIPYYLQAVQTGEAVSQAVLTVLQESPTHLALDANWGFGQVQAMRMLERLTEKARQHGQALGTMLHTGHIGRLGEYCEMAAEHGLVTILMVNSHGAAVRVAPPGGKAPRLSTNPLAIGVPHDNRHLILDFSTSATAEGKVRVKKIAGQPVPEGWLIDNQGRPTTDPNTLYGNPPGSILPMGGAQAYKGFGLGLMIEILTGALSGGVCAHEPLYDKKGNCVFMLVIDPQRFGGFTHFQNEVQQLVDYIVSCPRVEGCDQILLPGDIERATMKRLQETGIFLDTENWNALVRLANDLKIPPPAARS